MQHLYDYSYYILFLGIVIVNKGSLANSGLTVKFRWAVKNQAKIVLHASNTLANLYPPLSFPGRKKPTRIILGVVGCVCGMLLRTSPIPQPSLFPGRKKPTRNILGELVVCGLWWRVHYTNAQFSLHSTRFRVEKSLPVLLWATIVLTHPQSFRTPDTFPGRKKSTRII